MGSVQDSGYSQLYPPGMLDSVIYYPNGPRTPVKPQQSLAETPTGTSSEEGELKLKHSHFKIVYYIGNGLHRTYEGMIAFFNHATIQAIFNNQILSSFSQKIGKVIAPLHGRLQYLKGFSVFGILYIPRMLKSLRKFAGVKGSARFDHLMKAAQAGSVILDSLVKTAVGLETFNFSVKLSASGYPLVESIFKSFVKHSFPLGVVSWTLSYANLALDVKSLWKSTMAFEVSLHNENHIESILQKIKDIPKKKRMLQKLLDVNDVDSLLGRLSTIDEHNKIDLNQKIINRHTTIIFQKQLTVCADTLNFIATPLILTSFLHPAGYVCVAGYAAITAFTFFHRQLKTYQFENEMEMIQRSDKDRSLMTTGKLRYYYQTKDFAFWFFRLKTYNSFVFPS